jgi:nitrite reductase/ring-hydroxylating ferredoxin subunit
MTYQWYDVGAVESLPPGSKLRAEVDGFPVCLIHLAEGDLLACEDACPHNGVSLGHGGFVDTDEGTITCGAHQWCFRLSDGACEDFPGVRLRRYPVAVDGGRLYIGFWRDEGDGADPINADPQTTL